MLVDVCTFVGLVILYVVYDWHAMRDPTAPATSADGWSRRQVPAPKVVGRCRPAATRLTLVPGRARQRHADEARRRRAR
jgi:hypothetical protein